ncbi:winged helix-turn-helix transcriptional regulator [Streptomyces inhibens]|uniref:winged helix-turn-helix transcriptional regulator n=1 Tax=Streptomyces inhibens TaxID=2293571 RepID=UPI00402A8DD1
MYDLLDPESERGRVYRSLVSHPGAPAGALAARTGLSESTVRQLLKELAAEDMVMTVGQEPGA